MASYTINRNQFLDSALEQRATISIGNRGPTTFKSDLQEIWEGVQADRSDMLTQVRTLQLAVQLLMQGESQRLATLARDDDRVAILAAAALRVGERVAMLDEELAIAEVRVPMVKKTEALLNGRITDDAARATGALTVTLADENGVAIPGVPPVETDSAGYYALVVPAAAAAALGPDQKLQVLLSNGNERVSLSTLLQLKAGEVVVHDVGLSDKLLDTLKLRLPTRTVSVGTLQPRGEGAARAPAVKAAEAVKAAKPGKAAKPTGRKTAKRTPE